MSGAKQYRSLWKENFDDANGLIFVIDAADHLRVVVAESELSEATRTLATTTAFLRTCHCVMIFLIGLSSRFRYPF
jgi:hypothetical protein